MQTVKPEFNARSWLLSSGHSKSNQSDKGADGGGLLSLEMQDNSFQVFMNRINWLINTGLKEDVIEAYDMARRAWLESDFGSDREKLLQDKLDEIVKIITKDRVLGGAFTQSALGIEPSEPAAPQSGLGAPVFSARFGMAA